jgi:hypothetical protein
MNDDFEIIRKILADLKSDYITGCHGTNINPATPITERDIVAEIYARLVGFCKSNKLYVHCEVKPATNDEMMPEELKALPRIDVVILSDKQEKAWLSSAIKLQDRYKKGAIEARFSSVPIEFFHTAIEVKIQSNLRDARKDIDLLKNLLIMNPNCNCFFVLLNVRGQRFEHDAILSYAEKNGICAIEYCNC